MIKQQIHNKLKGKKTLVATSAGSDSMALLNMLYEAKIEIVACYIDHLQRPTEVALEMTYLTLYCQERAIPFFSMQISPIQKGQKQNKQEYFRQERYRLLQEVAKKTACACIVTAHHLNDQAETLLMRLIKGYSLSSMTGIQLLNQGQGVPIYRPLLHVLKQDLLTYCHENELRFFEDSSNADNNYFRNSLRNQVLPLFEAENQQFVTQFTEQMDDVVALEQFVTQQLIEEIDKNQVFDKKKKTIYVTKLRALLEQYPTAIQKIVLSLCLKKITPPYIQLSLEQKKLLLDVLLENQFRYRLEIEKGLYLRIQYDMLYIEQDANNQQAIAPRQQQKIKVTKGEQTYNNLCIYCGAVAETRLKNNLMENTAVFQIYVSQELFDSGLYLRLPRHQDTLDLTQGSKKINRLYIDKKVQPHLRFTYPVLVTPEDAVVADILTQRIGDKFRLDTKKITDETIVITIVY